MDNPIPNSILKLLDQVCEPDPEKSDAHQKRPRGVTPEIVQQIQSLNDDEVALLPKTLVLYNQLPSDLSLPIKHDRQKAWAAEQLASCAGPRVIPSVVQALEATDDYSTKKSLLSVLGKIGEPALESLDKVFFGTDDIGLVTYTVDILLELGQPAAYLIALALEHPEYAATDLAMRRISYDKYKRSDVNIRLVHDISNAILEELIIRDPTRPNNFNNKTTAECLKVIIHRSPQLRRTILTKLRDIAFEDNLEIRERAVQVAANLDIDNFLQDVRMKAREYPDIASQIFYRLGIDTPAPSQQQSLTHYTEQLKNLEKRSLERWDEMASRSKTGFYLRNALTMLYFLANLTVIGIGLWMLVNSDTAITQGIGGFVSASTAIGNMLARSWKAPVEDIKDTFIQQAGIEVTFIGFMTRIGQIKLLFEQKYAKGEIEIEDIHTLQKMMSETQSQTSQELMLVRTAASQLHQITQISEDAT